MTNFNKETFIKKKEGLRSKSVKIFPLILIVQIFTIIEIVNNCLRNFIVPLFLNNILSIQHDHVFMGL